MSGGGVGALRPRDLVNYNRIHQLSSPAVYYIMAMVSNVVNNAVLHV